MEHTEIVEDLKKYVTTYADIHEIDFVEFVRHCNIIHKVSVTGLVFDVLESIDDEFKQLPDVVKMSMVSFALQYNADIDRRTIQAIVRTLCAK